MSKLVWKPLWLLPVLLVLVLALYVAVLKKSPIPMVTFHTLDAQSIAISQLKGKVVLVNFWATSCPTCVAEMPALQALYKRYHAQGLEIIAVAMPYDASEQVRQYRQTHAFTFKMVHDVNAQVTRAFGGIELTPTTFLYDRQGRQVQYTVGELDFKQLEQQIRTAFQAK